MRYKGSMSTTSINLPPEIRFNKPERTQYEFRDVCLEELVSETHQVRLVWDYVCSLDLSLFCKSYKAIGDKAGRNPTDPRILLTAWLFATIEGVSSGRKLASLCERDAVYMWICGHVGVNYNMLNEFRVNHQEALLDLMTQTIASLHYHQLIDFTRVSQDGIRVRANAGKSSFRKKKTLEQLSSQVEEEVRKILTADEGEQSDIDKRSQAARKHAAEDKQRRIHEALKTHDKLSEQREARKKGDGEKTRTSTTDPEARNMKMADGGFRPAMNIQAATLNDSRIVVAVEATNEGTDSGQMKPMLDAIEQQHGHRPKEILADGGFNSREDVTAVETSGTTLYSPPKARRKEDADSSARRPGDSDEVANWRKRMQTEEAKEIYKERSSTAEFPFARFRNQDLQQLPVRGLLKAKTIALWHALTHNFRQIQTMGWLQYVVMPRGTN
jgi:transposase